MADRDALLPLPVRLCQACATVVDADGGAITLSYTEPSRVTLCATDEAAARLEDLQDVLGQGPGPDAYNSGETVIAELAGADPAGRWLMLADAARSALGFVATVYAVPIRPESDVLGVLTLYQATRRGLALDLGNVEFLAAALGAALLRDPGSQTELSPGPWASRARVHQATGVLVAQLRISPDDALALLRAHAYAHDATLDDIAAEVVTRRLDFDITDSNRNEDA
jgi:ANTAR domain-containing protein/GAF domain-containing protein